MNKTTIIKPLLWSIPKTTWHARLKEKAATLQQRLETIFEKHQQVFFATSLAAEDMLLTHAFSQNSTQANKNLCSVKFVTLDTGRLPEQTHEMIKQVEAKYNINILRLTPKPKNIEKYIADYGLNGFYDSEVAKKACCHIRKIIPLQESLKEATAWVSGQRREQSTTRATIEFEEVDWLQASKKSLARHKFNPLFDWADVEVWAYLHHFNVPIHPLHLQGFPSIGCEPCTRAIRAGEDIRAGRWWWLQKSSKECGLHKGNKGNNS